MQTKILSTIGPITCQISQIRKLLKYGDILRTNGSHNTLNWHKKISKLIKSVNPEAVHLFDIPGIKPRTKNQKTILINKGEKICLFYGKKINNKSKLKIIELTKPLPYLTNKKKNFSLSDGQYLFKLLDYKKNFLIGKSLSKFKLLPHRGLNIPEANYDNSLQLKHYKKFLEKSKSIKFDAIGLSYIQTRKTIDFIKNLYKDKIIVSKIENLDGLKNIQEIVDASDVIMIDRGDLAAEVGNHKLFNAVIEITKETKKQGKPLIMATENLDSMIMRNTPTKSEVISLGLNSLLESDYVMLSEETAISHNWHNILKWLNNFQSNSKNFNHNYINRLVSEDNKFHTHKDNQNDIWSSVRFNRNDSFVFVSRSGASIKEFKKRYFLNKSFVFTDSIKTRNLCRFWKEVKPFYLKSIGGFNGGKDVIKMIKKKEKIIFDFKTKSIICLFILNPRKKSRANCIYLVKKNDLKISKKTA